MPKPMPSKEALETEYANAASLQDLARIYRVSLSTIERWFKKLGVTAREATGRSVAPERRSGGRRYKRNGKKPQHVSPALARRLRELKRDHPDWTVEKVKAEGGATCTRQMVALVLNGKRCVSFEAFPPDPLPVAVAELDFKYGDERDRTMYDAGVTAKGRDKSLKPLGAALRPHKRVAGDGG